MTCSLDETVVDGTRARNRARLDAGEWLAGRYAVGHLLGAGGCAAVYSAVDQLLGERVALKIQSSRQPADRALERLLREGRLARRISHPNVCRVFDAGVDRRTCGVVIPFLSMELIEGETLSDRLHRLGPLPISEAVRLGRQIADALAAVHCAGVIHRDLKSANVLVTSDLHERAVLIDFGIALDTDARGAALTRPGSVAGTPAYMSPEQALGLPATMASDVYALGTVLYELCTGVLPYSCDAPVEVMTRKQMAAPIPDPRRLRPDLPALLHRVIRRCLAAIPGERFGDATEVIRALGGPGHSVRRRIAVPALTRPAVARVTMPSEGGARQGN
jgi:serine/threonine protein kinase